MRGWACSLAGVTFTVVTIPSVYNSTFIGYSYALVAPNQSPSLDLLPWDNARQSSEVRGPTSIEQLS